MRKQQYRRELGSTTYRAAPLRLRSASWRAWRRCPTAGWSWRTWAPGRCRTGGHRGGVVQVGTGEVSYRLAPGRCLIGGRRGSSTASVLRGPPIGRALALPKTCACCQWVGQAPASVRQGAYVPGTDGLPDRCDSQRNVASDVIHAAGMPAPAWCWTSTPWTPTSGS